MKILLKLKFLVKIFQMLFRLQNDWYRSHDICLWLFRVNELHKFSCVACVSTVNAHMKAKVCLKIVSFPKGHRTKSQHLRWRKAKLSWPTALHLSLFLPRLSPFWTSVCWNGRVLWIPVWLASGTKRLSVLFQSEKLRRMERKEEKMRGGHTKRGRREGCGKEREREIFRRNRSRSVRQSNHGPSQTSSIITIWLWYDGRVLTPSGRRRGGWGRGGWGRLDLGHGLRAVDSSALIERMSL